MLAKGLIYQVAAENSLYEFIKLMWEYLEPGREFRNAIHLQAICEHLEAVSRGEIKKLLINIPPGFSKSLTCNVFWPAWEWIQWPHMRYLTFSYASSLTERDNGRFATLIRSELYKTLWGEKFALTKDNQVKVENNRFGFKIASSVGGTGTGERGNRIIIDDANNIKEVESKTTRDETNRWYTEVLPSRVIDPNESVFICIQQRSNEDDVSGLILSRDMGYEHLCLPLEFDSQRKCSTSIGWEDWREEDGELLWPEVYDREAVDKLKSDTTISKYAYAGQYMQSPSPRGGGIIKADWWKLWPKEGEAFDEEGRPLRQMEYPVMDFILGSVDPAYTEKQENDPSAMVVLGLYREDGHPRVMLMDAWQERFPFHGVVPPRRAGEPLKEYKKREGWGLVERVAFTAHEHRCDLVLVENKASGISLGQELRRLYYDEKFGVQLFNPKGDKIARAHSVVHLIENGIVAAPNRDWATMVIDQCMPGNTLIYTSNGLKRIDEINPGDSVLTHKGRFRTVLAVGEREVNSLIKLSPKTLDDMFITEEHPIYAGYFTCEKKLKNTDWILPKNIVSRVYKPVTRSPRGFEAAPSACHACTIPIVKRENPIDFIDLRDWLTLPLQNKSGIVSDELYILNSHTKCRKFLWKQPLDFRFGRILGLYIAEGSSRRYHRYWSFNGKDDKEMHLAIEVRDFFRERFGVEVNITRQPSVISVQLCLSLMEEFFSEFGSRAHLKKIPSWMWDAPDDFLEGVFSGYAEGDGWQKNGVVICTTVSLSLAWGVRLLLLRLGYKPTISLGRAAGKQNIKGRECNVMQAYRLSVRLNKEQPSPCHLTDDLAYYQVMEKSEIRSDAPVKVYNMEVHGDNSYTTTSGVVHNCAVFPRGAHDDLVDALVMGLLHLRNTGWALRRNEYEDSIEPKEYSKSGGAIYDV